MSKTKKTKVEMLVTSGQTPCPSCNPATGSHCIMAEGHFGPHRTGGIYPHEYKEEWVTKCPDNKCCPLGKCNYHETFVRNPGHEECIYCGDVRKITPEINETSAAGDGPRSCREEGCCMNTTVETGVKTGLVDALGNPIHVGDLLYNKSDMCFVYVKLDTNSGLHGKIVCDPSNPCADTIRSLNDGKEYFVCASVCSSLVKERFSVKTRFGRFNPYYPMPSAIKGIKALLQNFLSTLGRLTKKRWIFHCPDCGQWRIGPSVSQMYRCRPPLNRPANQQNRETESEGSGRK